MFHENSVYYWNPNKGRGYVSVNGEIVRYMDSLDVSDVFDVINVMAGAKR